MQSTSKFQAKLLNRQTGVDDYRVYRAALEWDLTDPIVIDSSADFKSTPRWRDRLTPFHHQVTNLITFCRRLPVTLLADDVGLGKTISAGLVMSELIARARLSKTLIVCPKVLCPQWQQELESKFDIPAQIATGRDLLKADPDGTGAIITTYNSARLYLARIPEDRFQMLVLDEAHKLRNLHGTPQSPQVAKTFFTALQDRRFRFVLMLTATPIQNRLWDLYSLVDLLTAARGHENPFGSPGMFARKFIADDKDKARQLKPAARDEFRSIVYGYMSRVRRGDAKLAFPERKVQMHRVKPTSAELELIAVIAKPIQKMNRLAQIGILQALVSSPHALASQLTNMARNGTAPVELATTVAAIVASMPPSAKLNGLGVLIDQLKKQNQNGWRLVVFTTRRETQTTIQDFLQTHGLKVGIINGDSGQRNQETITSFRQTPPGYRVIVSTEAGSEGVNLQVANVLVNYDLPWNPMIVEQRIGRVQRLGSDHAFVSIFNMTLQGTFEEYIVGRLMEKLQMASHAIGDIEALLQGSDIGEGEEDAAATFEDRILSLVLSALTGKNVEKDVRLKETSIENAKRELEREEASINSLLGGMDGVGYVGPRSPTFPPSDHSMDVPTFTLSALRMLGFHVSEQKPGVFLAEERASKEYVAFEEQRTGDRRITLYSPQTPAFQRLVKRVATSGIHDVKDADSNPEVDAAEIARQWLASNGATMTSHSVVSVVRGFDGNALLRVRANTAHDSYERLVSCACSREDHGYKSNGADGLAPVDKLIRDVATIGIDADKVRAAGERDDAIAEFSRFYLERGRVEMESAGSDERKRRKLEDDFTPRLDMTLVGLEGVVQRDLTLRTRYTFPSGGDYESDLIVRPSSKHVIDAPATDRCAESNLTVPKSCLGTCEISGGKVLRHLLTASDVSGREALPQFMAKCAFSGKLALQDELEKSDVTGRQVASAFIKTSVVSGKRAEPDQFEQCSFTQADCLKSELCRSEISGRSYRLDQQRRSELSGKAGHKDEFISCFETRQLISTTEAESCDVTQKKVRPGILATCDVTGKRVLPSALAICSVTKKRALKTLLVSSSVSETSLLPEVAVASVSGRFCAPAEVQECSWSGRKVHPDDLRTCGLTGLSIHTEFATSHTPPRLRPLMELLDGVRRNADQDEVWGKITGRLSAALKGGKCRVEAAVVSPSKQRMASCSEWKTLLGLRVHQVGAIYDLADNALIGRLAEGKRRTNGWVSR
jgi:superfamily II DNA or RNA helicase